MAKKLGYSIIANSLIDICSIIDSLDCIDFLHIDMMDGNYVEDLTIGPSYVCELREKYPSYYFDVHLMVTNPLVYIRRMAGIADRIIVHVEIDGIEEVVREIRSCNLSLGLCISPSSDVSMLESRIGLLDMPGDTIQIMSVEPGKCGQAFNRDMVDRIRYIKNEHEDIRIQVDGGIDAETIKLCEEAGADSYVSGSSMLRDGKMMKAELFN